MKLFQPFASVITSIKNIMNWVQCKQQIKTKFKGEEKKLQASISSSSEKSRNSFALFLGFLLLLLRPFPPLPITNKL